MESDAHPAPASYKELASLLDLPITAPELTTAQVVELLAAAKRYEIGSVTVRPCDIDLAVRSLAGSTVRPGAVAGFPYGSSSTGVKLYEIRDLLRRGAVEIEMVAPIPKLVSREFPYVQTEFLQAAEACHREHALLKVATDSPYLTEEMKIVACRCAERAEVDVVKGAAKDVALLRKHLPEETGIEAAGVEGVEQLLELHAAGCTRFSTGDFGRILDEWKGRAAAEQPEISNR
jgi:deoxyribose-phosphate aldolase